MSGRLIGVILCLALLSVGFLAATADGASSTTEPANDAPDDPPVSPIKWLRGYVLDIPAQEERKPIMGVTINTWTQNNEIFETTMTVADGSFKVEYNENVKYISFTMAEFTVKGWSSELKKYGDTGKFEIALKDDSQVDGYHDLFDDSGYTVMISRTNASVYGKVTTVIENEDVPIGNAVVTLVYNKNTFSATTDAFGNFTINCSSGVHYDMRVSAGGFFDWTSKDIVPGETALSISLEQKNHDVFMNFDLTHTLALIGILIIILLVLISVYLIKKPEKEDGLYVVNDLEPKVPKKE